MYQTISFCFDFDYTTFQNSHYRKRFTLSLLPPNSIGILTKCTTTFNVSRALNVEFEWDTSNTLQITSPDNWSLRLNLITIGLSFWFTSLWLAMPTMSAARTSCNACSNKSFTLARIWLEDWYRARLEDWEALSVAHRPCWIVCILSWFRSVPRISATSLHSYSSISSAIQLVAFLFSVAYSLKLYIRPLLPLAGSAECSLMLWQGWRLSIYIHCLIMLNGIW